MLTHSFSTASENEVLQQQYFVQVSLRDARKLQNFVDTTDFFRIYLMLSFLCAALKSESLFSLVFYTNQLYIFFFLLSTGMYTSKSGSKSFDELDDILGEKVKKTHSSPHSSMIDDTSRHSCDELMMTRSLYEAETSDTASQV